jgi:hypothetical protein
MKTKPGLEKLKEDSRSVQQMSHCFISSFQINRLCEMLKIIQNSIGTLKLAKGTQK